YLEALSLITNLRFVDLHGTSLIRTVSQREHHTVAACVGVDARQGVGVVARQAGTGIGRDHRFLHAVVGLPTGKLMREQVVQLDVGLVVDAVQRLGRQGDADAVGSQ